MNYIQSMPKEEVRTLIESGVPCYHKHGSWSVGWYGRNGKYNPMPDAKPISKERALELLPQYSFKGWWQILIPEDKSYVKFVEPSDSDLW